MLTERASEEQTAPGAEWWRGAAIYHVYVRSFADSNDDGIGDFQGLLSKA